MKRVLSTHLFSNHRLTAGLLHRIHDAGFPAVEIFCARQHFDYSDPAHVNEIGSWFADSELKLHSLHAPIYTDNVWGRSGPHSVINIAEPLRSVRIAAVEEIKRSLELAETVPFRYLIQHIGVAGEEYDDRKLDAAFTALEELSVFARQRKVEILLENIPNAFSSAERLVQFLNATHLNLNFVFDVGHARLGEGVETEYALMRERIRSTHLHDNDGQRDLHLTPMVDSGGAVDWSRAMRLLNSRPDQYPLVLELRDTPGMSRPLETAVTSFDRLENLLK